MSKPSDQVSEPRPLQGREKASFAIDGFEIGVSALQAGLYIVATPIGNLQDITLRALHTLAGVDLIACEDTRHSRKLLDHYAIRTPLTAYHEHNAAARRPELLRRLGAGDSIALISDAGTPLVSDPGFKLVEDAVSAGHVVVPLPGPSAVMAGLVAAGLPTNRFLFCGFLSSRSTARAKQLAALANIPATLVFYEAPGRVGASLAAMSEAFGPNRHAVLAREITKRFETFERGTLADLASQIFDQGIKGECVILVAPSSDKAVLSINDPGVAERLRHAVGAQGVKSAAATLAEETGLPRRALYQLALALQTMPKQ